MFTIADQRILYSGNIFTYRVISLCCATIARILLLVFVFK